VNASRLSGRTGLSRCPGVWLLLTVAWVVAPAVGAPVVDSDGDGLPDAVEAALGTDPQAAESFVSVLRRQVPAGHKDPGRFVTGAAVCNAGGNRFVWRVEFGADYPRDNSNLILYLDADNNPATGRQPNHGCEFMLRVTNGLPANTAWSPEGRSFPGAFPRVAIVGPSVYVSYDVDLAQRGGKSVFRLSILSETWKPHHGVDSTGYFHAEGPPMTDRPKVKLDSDLTRSEGVEQTFGRDRSDGAARAAVVVQRFPIPPRPAQSPRLSPTGTRLVCGTVGRRGRR